MVDEVSFRRVLSEAEHSIGLLVASCGSLAAASGYLAKWPDLVRSYLDGDESRFWADAEYVTCGPVGAVARGLAERMVAQGCGPIGAVAGRVAVDSLDALLVGKSGLVSACRRSARVLSSAGVAVGGIQSILEERNGPDGGGEAGNGSSG